MARGLVHIWRTAGVWGLYQGHTATLLRIFPYAAIKFVSYDQIRDRLIPTQEHEVWFRRIAAGSLAGTRFPLKLCSDIGLTSVCFTYPLELVRVRLAFETTDSRHISLRTICSRIYHERDLSTNSSSLSGLANFYRGFLPTIAGMIPYAGVSFWVHDWVGDILRSDAFAPYTLSHVVARNEREIRHPKLKNQWEAVAGGIAGAMAQTASYPIEVTRRRMQVGGAIGNGEMRGAWETVKSIYASGGVRGFYVGLSIGYIKVCPAREVLIVGYSDGE
jgi:solute carrier family 25 (mitochondrial carrier protein), member 16